MDTDEFATEAPQPQREEDKETRGGGDKEKGTRGGRFPASLVSLSPCPPLRLRASVSAVAWTKKSGRKIEREARLSGLSSRRVLFSLFFVSNFETDLWNQALPFDQSQRLVFQHAGGLGVQFRFAQFFVLPVCKKQQIDRTVVGRRFGDWFIDRFGLRRFGFGFCGGRLLKRRGGYFRNCHFRFDGFYIPKVQHCSFDLP